MASCDGDGSCERVSSASENKTIHFGKLSISQNDSAEEDVYVEVTILAKIVKANPGTGIIPGTILLKQLLVS